MAYNIFGRMVTRPNPNHPAGYDIGLIYPFTNVGKNPFKPNTVYEMLDGGGGVICFIEKGECCFSDKGTETLIKPGMTWAVDIEYILTCHKEIVLTREEFCNMQKKQEEDENG